MGNDLTVIEREIRVAASPETVFGFFTDSSSYTRWKGQEATLEPRPGGLYRVNLNGREVVRGEYLEVVPYSRVVFTWGWDGEGSPVPAGSSTVEVSLVPDGDGTLVRLLHRDLPSPGSVKEHADGWDHYLPRLAVAAAGGDPGPDPWGAPVAQQSTAS